MKSHLHNQCRSFACCHYDIKSFVVELFTAKSLYVKYTQQTFMMNSYLFFKIPISSPFDRNKPSLYDSTFKSIKSGNKIKRYSVVKTSNFLSRIFWGITFSSLFP